jgi:hypothetical protein
VQVVYLEADGLTRVILGWIELPVACTLFEARAHHFQTLYACLLCALCLSSHWSCLCRAVPDELRQRYAGRWLDHIAFRLDSGELQQEPQELSRDEEELHR